uniref:Cationic amino acid transporter C-terminal domain-containing protein n=1 Tax=Strigamia maritima TaxID=126957 RepID=T1IVD5_STRMM
MKFKRIKLNCFELNFNPLNPTLGVVSTLGTGVYAILGQVSRENAGPSVVLSYLYASVATFLTGLCYSELGSRYPRAGSAYVYAYATMGEFVGFLIGWNLILELALGASVASKACIQYVDALSNHSLSNCLQDKGVGVPLVAGVKPLDRSLDLPASILVVVVTIALITNILCVLNNLLTSLGVLLLAAIILVGISHTNSANWTKSPGFFPNSISGIICAASTSTYSFIGYEVMAGAAGETLTSHGQILASANVCAFVLGLLVAFPAAAFLTLFIPFYQINEQAPFLHAFETAEISVSVRYLIVTGAFCALLGSIIAALFSLSRLLQKMSQDGLLFRGLNHVSKSGVPWSSTLAGGIAVAAITLILDQHTLVEILGFGVLISSISVAASILVLRYGVNMYILDENNTSTQVSPMCAPPYTWHYLDGTWTKVTPPNSPQSQQETSQLLSPEVQEERVNPEKSPSDDDSSDVLKCQRYGINIAPRQMAVEYINDAFSVSLLTDQIPKRVPTSSSSRNSAIIIITMLLLAGFIAIVTRFLHEIPIWTLVVIISTIILIIILIIFLLCQPKHSPRVRHKVPCIPALPVGAILLQMPLLVYLPLDAWLRTCVWIFMGFVIYSLYSARHSKERVSIDDEILLVNRD